MSIPASHSNIIPLFHKESQKKTDAVGRPFPRRLLQNQDYTLILGRSGLSFQVPQLTETWQQARHTIQTLGQTCAMLDHDGLKVYLAETTGSQEAGTQSNLLTYEQVSKEGLEQLLHRSYPPANLDIVTVLEAALNDYFQRKREGRTQPNGELFLVMLDGEPRDRQRLVNLIVKSTQRMDHPQELAIGFVQIGEDPIAQGFFQSLDDDLHLAGAVYDIVHTQNFTTINCDQPLDFLWDVLTD